MTAFREFCFIAPGENKPAVCVLLFERILWAFCKTISSVRPKSRKFSSSNNILNLRIFSKAAIMIETVVIEGVICSGKSYTLRTLENCLPSVPVVHEPRGDYTKFSFNGKLYNPLDEYYRNPEKNAVCLQMHILNSLKESASAQLKLSSKVVVTERFLTSLPPFLKTMAQHNFLSDFSRNFILKMLHETLDEFSGKSEITKVIFLDTNIELCMQRFQTRKFKKEEQNFTPDQMKDYLKDLRENILEYYSENFPGQLEIIENNDLNLILQKLKEMPGIVLGESAREKSQ